MADYTQAAYNDLVAQIPARYGVQSTTYLKALLQAIAGGDGYIRTQIDATRANRLVISASGKYLDRLSSLSGIVRSESTGIQDSDFRQIIPVMGRSKKQVLHTLQRLIDVIYGPYATHANTTCSAPAPYALLPGSCLTIQVDGVTVQYAFQASDAADLTQATADEVARAITDRSGGRVIGSVVSNNRTGENFVNLRTSTIGSQGFIQVTGGDAQTALHFPQTRSTTQALATWNVAPYSSTGEMAYTIVSGTSPGMRSAGVQTGDFVTIRSDSGFSRVNTGTFQITYADDSGFRVLNGAGIPESGISQMHASDFAFYLPDLGNVLLASRPATILQTDPGSLTVLLPVTSPIVTRSLIGSHHFHGGMTTVLSATPTSVTLGSVLGLPTQGSILKLSNRTMNLGVCSTMDSSTITLVDSSGWPTSGAVFSPVTQTFYFYSGLLGNQLTGVTPAPSTLMVGTTLKYSPRFSYTGISNNQLTGVYPDPSALLNLEVTGQIYLDANFTGAFLYDKTALFSAAADQAHLDEKISQGSSRTVIAVDDVSEWPEQGYFVIEFANDEEEGPIKYLGKVGTGGLIIDPGQVFTRDHWPGVRIRRVNQLGAYLPRPTGQDQAVYLTGTSDARTLVTGFLNDLIAAGITLNFEISLPDQHWPVLPPLYSHFPTDPSLTN